jgi:hypothetical protein
MKKIIPLAIAALAINFMAPVVLQAQSPNATTSPSITTTPTAKNTKAVDKLKAKADKEIDRRVTQLQKLITKMSKTAKLDSTTKTTLTNEITAEIANLQALKTALAAETDLTKVRDQIKSLTNSYKAYAFYVPRLHILTTIDTMLGTVTKLTAAATTLEAQIATAKTAGTVTEKATVALTAMQEQTAIAKKQLEATQQTVLALAISGYPENKNTLKEAKKQLDTAHKAIQAARKEATTIKTELKK